MATSVECYPEETRKPAIESMLGRRRTWNHDPTRVRDVAFIKIIKHVKFTTLLKRATHDNPLVRKHAFEGIQDYISVGEYPWGSDKKENSMFEKLCYGITDTDDDVREAAYELLDMVKTFRNFENYVASLLVPSVMKALAHTQMGVHLTGKKVYDLLVQQIPSCLHLFISKAIQTLEDMMKNDVYEEQSSHLHRLRILQSVNACLSSLPSGEGCEIFFDSKSMGVLSSVLSAFPMDSEHFDIDIEVTKIFLRLPKLPDYEKLLAFINDKLHKITEGNLDELLAFFPPYVPVIVIGLGSHSQANLIKAFTAGFKRSRPESAFKLACAAAIELMVSGNFVEDVNNELFQLCRREWLEELSTLFGLENRSTSLIFWLLKRRLPLVMSILRSSADFKEACRTAL